MSCDACGRFFPTTFEYMALWSFTLIVCESKRLVLRHWKPTDAERYYELSQDQGFNSFVISTYRHEDVASASRWIATKQEKFDKQKYGALPVENRTDGTLMGVAGLKPLGESTDIEIFYRFARPYWGHGYATEIAMSIMSFGFQTLKLNRIVAMIEPKNVASIKVIEKLGFTFLSQSPYKDLLVNHYEHVV